LDAEIERGEHVSECGTSCVVKVEGDLLQRNALGHGVHDNRDLAWMRNADRVADRHFERAHVDQGRRDFRHAHRIHRSFEGAAEGG
jgi:hypothetical protein